MKRYRVEPGKKIDLSKIDPNDDKAFKGDKEKGLKALSKLNAELQALQELLYAEQKHKVLIVLQAMDTGGKDGAIRRVVNGSAD